MRRMAVSLTCAAAGQRKPVKALFKSCAIVFMRIWNGCLLSYHDQADTGDLVQRCSSDVETVRVFLASQVVEIARVSLFLIVAVPIMLVQDVRMTALSLGLIPVIVFFAVQFFRKVRGLFRQVDESEGRLTTVLQENLTGIRVVRAFARQDFETSKFLERNGEFRDLEYRLFIALTNYWTLSDVLVFTQLGLVLIGGAYFVVQGQITLGTWVLFWWLLRTIIWPVRHIGRVLADTGKATVAIGRIQEVLSEEPESDERVTDQPVPRSDRNTESLFRLPRQSQGVERSDDHDSRRGDGRTAGTTRSWQINTRKSSGSTV